MPPVYVSQIPGYLPYTGNLPAEDMTILLLPYMNTVGIDLVFPPNSTYINAKRRPQTGATWRGETKAAKIVGGPSFAVTPATGAVNVKLHTLQLDGSASTQAYILQAADCYNWEYYDLHITGGAAFGAHFQRTVQGKMYRCRFYAGPNQLDDHIQVTGGGGSCGDLEFFSNEFFSPVESAFDVEANPGDSVYRITFRDFQIFGGRTAVQIIDGDPNNLIPMTDIVVRNGYIYGASVWGVDMGQEVTGRCQDVTCANMNPAIKYRIQSAGVYQAGLL